MKRIDPLRYMLQDYDVSGACVCVCAHTCKLILIRQMRVTIIISFPSACALILQVSTLPDDAALQASAAPQIARFLKDGDQFYYIFIDQHKKYYVLSM